MNYVSLATIESTTRRIPFGSLDGQVLLMYLQTAAKNGLDIHPVVSSAEDAKEMFAEGVVLLRSEMLQRRFLFVNVDAGRNLFGRQKTHILSFLGDVHADEWVAGPSYKSLNRATTSINNIYRGVGILRGASL